MEAMGASSMLALSRGARALYWVLGEIRREIQAPGREYVWPTQEELAARIGCAAGTVRRHFGELERAGLMKAVRCQRGYRYYFLDVVGGGVA